MRTCQGPIELSVDAVTSIVQFGNAADRYGHLFHPGSQAASAVAAMVDGL